MNSKWRKNASNNAKDRIKDYLKKVKSFYKSALHSSHAKMVRFGSIRAINSSSILHSDLINLTIFGDKLSLSLFISPNTQIVKGIGVV